MTVSALLLGASCANDSSPAGGTGSSTTAPDSGEAQSDNNGDPTASTTPSTSTTGSGSSSTTQSTTAGETEGTTGEPPPTAEVHLVGRFDDGQQFTWSGTLMRTRISGSDLDLQLDGAGGVRFQVVVDGTPTDVFETQGGPQTYAVAAGLVAGEHDVEVVRRNEGYFGAVQFVDFVPGAGTTLVATPSPYEHRIEFIGDSLTAGYGIECTDGNQSFSGETESAWSTYAMVASRELAAAPHLIAYSGKGAFQNYGGNLDQPMPQLYPRTLTDDPNLLWDFSSWPADVVVVNLGTNDFSAAIAMGDFVGAYTQLLQTVRTNHPDALVVAVTWASWGAEHEGWVQSAVTVWGDANAITTQFTIEPDEGFGCDFHSNVTTNARLGSELAQTLRTELGW
jgi:lysophospholipase L1-like esterase